MISLLPVQTVNSKKPSFSAKLTVLSSTIPKARTVSDNESARTNADNYMKQGQFDKAIDFYKQALECDSENLETHLSIAKTYTYNNQHKEAIPHLEKFVNAKSDDIENITLLGECYKKSGNYSKAEQCFKDALLIEPHYDYAKRNLLDNQNLRLACINPTKAQQERYTTAVKNLTEAVKIAKNFLPKGYTKDMKDLSVTFDRTAKMGGRSNIAQYEHNQRKISITDEYTYANPKLTGAYLIHEFVHGKDNDPYTSIREEQDAYRVQAQFWTQKVNDVYDPEMDYVADLYKQSASSLDERVAEIYRQRDPGIPDISNNHPPSALKVSARSLSSAADQPIKAYDIIV